MRRKDLEDLKKFGKVELQERLSEAKKGFYHLRLQANLGQLKDTAALGRAKRDIARILTLLNDRKKV